MLSLLISLRSPKGLEPCAAVCKTPQSKKPNLVGWAKCLIFIGAGEMNRTPDLLITNELLYRLSYTGDNPKL